MDLTPLITEAFKVLYIIPVLIIIGIFKTSWFKGKFGEFIFNVSVKLQLNKDKYHLIKNVTLPTDNGTTQIDHIIVSQYGVFVVEIKNMKGWIFGSANQSTWTQQIYKHRNKFQNPLRQNYKHVKTLQALLDLKDEQIYSLVVFVGESTFKTAMPDNVTHGGRYVKYIKSKTQEVFTESGVELIKMKIESERFDRSFRTDREHVKHVKSIVSTKASNPQPALGMGNQVNKTERIPSESWDPVAAEMICPKCDSNMVLRKARKGQNAGKLFLGCSQFPKCRGTINI